MHRNGVKVLGTFMVEGDGAGIENLLTQVDGDFVMARQLARMADVYGFDGWLLNIESEFPGSCSDPVQRLAAFIRTLKRNLRPSDTVVWYDSLTKENEVAYQNALTEANVDIALAADAFFTNYKWSEEEMLVTKVVADRYALKSSEVYFGIDVWAQNTDMPGPPRVTYPREGGGGTLTGLVSWGKITPSVGELAAHLVNRLCKRSLAMASLPPSSLQAGRLSIFVQGRRKTNFSQKQSIDLCGRARICRTT